MNRIVKQVEALQIWFEGTVARWNASLRRFSVFDVVLDAADAFATHQMSLLAAALTYYALLALFPLLLLLVSTASFFVSEQLALDTVMRWARNYLPGIEQQVMPILREVVTMRGPATLIGFLALLWSASGVFDVVQQALDRAWQVAERRSFWLQRAYSIGVIALLGGMLLLSMVVSSASVDFFYWLLGDANAGEAVTRTMANWIAFALSWAAFFLLYKFFPHTRVSWRAALLASIAAALSWQVAKYGYGVYLTWFARYNLVYGSLGAIIGLLFWGYISAMILLFGAELSARIGRAQKQN